jgi:hypothetical protein
MLHLIILKKWPCPGVQKDSIEQRKNCTRNLYRMTITNVVEIIKKVIVRMSKMWISTINSFRISCPVLATRPQSP